MGDQDRGNLASLEEGNCIKSQESLEHNKSDIHEQEILREEPESHNQEIISGTQEREVEIGDLESLEHDSIGGNLASLLRELAPVDRLALLEEVEHADGEREGYH